MFGLNYNVNCKIFWELGAGKLISQNFLGGAGKLSSTSKKLYQPLGDSETHNLLEWKLYNNHPTIKLCVKIMIKVVFIMNM